MLTYEEFAVLVALNLWVELGFPEDDVVRTAASFSEGDPRGTVSVEQCQKTFDELVTKGWIRSGPASDDTERTFVYSSPAGTAAFQESYDYWMKRARE